MHYYAFQYFWWGFYNLECNLKTHLQSFNLDVGTLMGNVLKWIIFNTVIEIWSNSSRVTQCQIKYCFMNILALNTVNSALLQFRLFFKNCIGKTMIVFILTCLSLLLLFWFQVCILMICSFEMFLIEFFLTVKTSWKTFFR